MVRASQRLASLQADGGTPMAEGITYGAYRLLQEDVSRRVLLVLTDGQPYDQGLTESVVERCWAEGILVAGIGIGVKIGHLFNPSIEIGDVSHLDRVMFSLVRDLIRRAQTIAA